MVSLLLPMLLAFAPYVQEPAPSAQFEVRARQSLLLGKGDRTALPYYDVVITRQPDSGVLVKLPYTRKGGKFTFDLHHRVALTENFGLPAELTTVVEVLTGGTNSLGIYTIVDRIESQDRFDEGIVKTSTAEIDRYVTPISRKTITIDTLPGPQSISIVGQTLTITRGTTTTRVDTPGTRIAAVSNFKFEPVTEVNPLKSSEGGN
jgi:hypothetical protein